MFIQFSNQKIAVFISIAKYFREEMFFAEQRAVSSTISSCSNNMTFDQTGPVGEQSADIVVLSVF